MSWYHQVKNKISRTAGIIMLGVGIVAIAAVVIFVNRADESIEQPSADLPAVTLTTAQQYAGQSTINLIGTVRAFSEASITAERAGRVTTVRVGLGDTVAAGQIIATLENASENASVLSAQGAYEAALAAAAQNEVGTQEAATRLRTAKNNAVSTIQTVYNTVEGVVFNNIDQFFTDPDSQLPGLRINGQGLASQINDTRVEFQTILPAAETAAQSVTVNSDLAQQLNASEALLSETIAFVNTFVTLFTQQDNSVGRYTDQELAQFGTSFNAARGSLLQLQSQIDTVRAAIEDAEAGVVRAELAATGGVTSAADAQVKQALGSLRSAQANLAKTIIRTPISGTVNSLNVRTGDFIGSFAQVAEVANNNALEVVTFAGKKDLSVISVGDTVTIEDQYQGTVTEVAPAVDTNTGKTEVRIASESPDLQNGDAVSITKQVAESVSTDVIIPLSAIKFAMSDGSVFVVENNQLVARNVTLGTIRGGSVEVLDGLASDDAFVADARGLNEGAQVEVMQ